MRKRDTRPRGRSTNNPLGARDGLGDALLAWWRTRPPSAYRSGDCNQLTAILATLDLPGSSSWRAAMTGDAAASLAIAFDRLPTARLMPATFDAAMTTVLICALEGDPACRDMLVHVLGRRGRCNAALPLVWLAGAWKRAGRSSGWNASSFDSSRS